MISSACASPIPGSNFSWSAVALLLSRRSDFSAAWTKEESVTAKGNNGSANRNTLPSRALSIDLTYRDLTAVTYFLQRVLSHLPARPACLGRLLVLGRLRYLSIMSFLATHLCPQFRHDA